MPADAMGPLASELSTFEQSFRSKTPADLIKAIDASSVALAARFTPTPPAIGTTVESFELPNAKGKTVSLASLLSSNKAVVLTYYRGSWCPYCNMALRSLTQSVGELKALGATLVCLSPETPDESMSTKEKNELPFEVLSDDGLVVAEKLGVAFTVGDDVKEIYGGFGINLDEMNGNKSVRKAKLPAPATIVLDKEGKVVYSFANVDYSKRAEPSDIIDAIKKINA